MTSILVAGGVYRERCVWPEWKRTFGSAGRAASAAASLVESVDVLTPSPPEVIAEYEQEAALDGICVRRAPVGTDIPPMLFDYVHGLSVPEISPAPAMVASPVVFDAASPLVLRFGMLEATARVTADVCVYDPQSAFMPEAFAANGSHADRLAIVGNRGEIAALGRDPDPISAARAILLAGAEVVVVKSGAAGAAVVTSEMHIIPARLTGNVWPIGSGDVFAAAFAVAWAIDGLKPTEAADFASYAVADYVETMGLPISPGLRMQRTGRDAVIAKGSKVYLAGPFFSMSQRWLVDEARRCLRELGMQVFSPFHDIGRGPAHKVAPADLEALTGCDCVLALLDGLDSGTQFEVGWARAIGRPVYGFAQVAHDEDLKMVTGSGCQVFADFVTCLHHCAWGT